MAIKKIIRKLLPDKLYRKNVSLFHDMKYQIRQIKANRYLKAITHKKPYSDVIRVGFIVQMPEIWDKEAPLFEEMISDERIKPYLIVFPSFDFANSQIASYGKELDFFRSKYSDNLIIKAYDNDVWIDLQKMKFEYVFYQRCWERYLPSQYHTKNVIKYSKTCYIPYCFHALDLDKVYYYKSFFCNLYMFYCCSTDQLQELPNCKYRHNVFKGYPAINTVKASTSRNDKFTVLWTPRWVDDQETGGSSFLKYIDVIEQISTENKDVQLILRPHPLAFQNAIKSGAMTEEEVLSIKDRLSRKGIIFDKNEFVEDTFAYTDLLISDFSSILVHFYLSGKPIIYCSSVNVRFSRTFKYIIDSSYIAENWDEVLSYTKRIRRGDDPLKKERLKKIDDIIKEHIGATKRIVDDIYMDFEYHE